jgi:aerobic-type carbon monoxide dehydrogenase small subunit (CoxS/CutS family)
VGVPSVTVNGERREAARGDRNLLSYLRFDLGLTGTKYGCGEGLCGACTVLVDGQPIRSCLSTVGAVSGGRIVTIEGLAGSTPAGSGLAGSTPAGSGLEREGELHAVQRAFVAEQAMQCGYCIPGFVMSAVALLERERRPSSEQIREALSEHVCRCGTYQRIQRAVERAAGELGG